jgi:hypothetical protein
MRIAADQIDRILDELMPLMEADEEIVAIGVDPGEGETDPRIVVRHLNPNKAQLNLSRHRHMSLAGEAIELPLVVEQSDPLTLQLAQPDEPSFLDDLADSASLVGMSGTKVGRSGGGWGTLCLSGSRISATFDGKSCAVDGPFVCTNSHVADAVGTQLVSFNKVIGTVDCVFDLEARLAFDFATCPWTQNLRQENFFTVFEAGGRRKEIAGLRVVGRGAIAKQGARTGWSTGQVGNKERIRVSGHKGIYPAWRGSYRSDNGDSGSPVLQQIAGQWYLVGIHFSSGPYFQSWDYAQVQASG